ncbi:MAG: hypothetical protein QNJ18_05335 [Xenococcaceae cyanobacterium MO_167.B52]|nr:hypothetical protein [Xenococcaceae cyanobacterium MO_167.B52]
MYLILFPLTSILYLARATGRSLRRSLGNNIFAGFGVNKNLIYELEEGERMGIREVYELEMFFKRLFQIDKIDLVNSAIALL